MAQLMPALMALDRPGPLGQAYQRLTLTHATLGAQSFGISPGAAEIWVTLRTTEDAQMAALQSQLALGLIRRLRPLRSSVLAQPQSWSHARTVVILDPKRSQ